eukprot:356940-Chlamydomonas_euryale.AAC.7
MVLSTTIPSPHTHTHTLPPLADCGFWAGSHDESGVKQGGALQDDQPEMDCAGGNQGLNHWTGGRCLLVRHHHVGDADVAAAV